VRKRLKGERGGRVKTREQLEQDLARAEHVIAEMREAEKRDRKTIEALRKSEAEYRELVELANSIILRLDTAGNIIFLNQFGRNFFGYTRKEIIGKKLVGTLVPPVESSGRDLAEIVKWISENPDKYTTNENENIRKDGSRAWVLWTNKAVLDSAGRLIEVLSIGNDITDRKEAERALWSARDELEAKVGERTRELKEACDNLQFEIVEKKIGEEALRESEAKYRSIVERAVEGIFQTTEDGRCVMANAALCRILGYETPEELVSAVTDVGSQLYVNPEDQREFERLLDARGYVEGFETQYYRKDRSTIWVSMHVRAVHDERGSFICYEGIIEDITMRKKGEEQLKESFVRLQRVMGGTITALSMAVEIRDPYTAGHQVRVTQLAKAIAEEMGLSEDAVKAIEVAGLLHDIGKIYVPAEILTRPGRISEHEFAVLRDHTLAGYEILKDIEFDHPIAEIVLQHHEKMDGSGYPQGLAGDEINIYARIISVADVVESMASHRPYRPSLGMEKALIEIAEQKGTLYDEQVADICLKLFKEERFSFGA
jgi:PAS domain S-box-containing protein/putative nucleotidyltransferase with HDIG domain